MATRRPSPSAQRQNGPEHGVLYVCAKRCKSCIYSKNSPSRRSIEELEREASETFRECHIATIHGNTACCRGSYDSAHSPLLRLAHRLGVAVFVDPQTMEPV